VRWRESHRKKQDAKADPSFTIPKLRPKKHKSLFGDPEITFGAPFTQDDTFTFCEFQGQEFSEK
jgi:hypothetical protein